MNPLYVYVIQLLFVFGIYLYGQTTQRFRVASAARHRSNGPLHSGKFKGTLQDYYEPDLNNPEIKLTTIYNIKLLTGRDVIFKSWAYQRLTWPGATTADLHPGIRLIPQGNRKPIFSLFL